MVAAGTLVCIKTHQNTFLSANASGYIMQRLLWAHGCELFRVVDIGNGKGGFKTHHDTYLRAGDHGEVNQAPRLREWEHWEIIELANGKYNLKCIHGGYLRALPVSRGGTVDVFGKCGDVTTELEIVPVFEGPFAFVSPVDGKVLLATPTTVPEEPAMKASEPTLEATIVNQEDTYTSIESSIPSLSALCMFP
jgi:hypothetical protein